MSTAESEFKAEDYAARRSADAPVIGRATLSVAIAAVEGAVASAVVLGSAFAYHGLVLRIPAEAFDWPLYLLFAGLAGLLYGAFSAAATGRFLESGERNRSTWRQRPRKPHKHSPACRRCSARNPCRNRSACTRMSSRSCATST